MIPSRCLIIVEFILLFALICVHGSWPVPDENEANYVGKAIHFWNPDWVKNDTFLESKDAHYFFYATIGPLSLVLSPTAFAWTARLIAWFLFAFSWQRFSFALIPKRFFSILTAAGMLYLLDAFWMSGEWLIGGVEGKSYAFPLMFLGLESMLRGKWKTVWPFLGAASAFHVLVGGWAVVLALFVWFWEQIFCGVKENFCNNNDRGCFSRLWAFFVQFFINGVKQLPFLFLGGAISLFGLVPALSLDHGVTPEVASRAHFIYVYERLAHHLHPAGFPWTFKLRFGVLTLLWLMLCGVLFFHKRNDNSGQEFDNCFSKRFMRLNGFVLGTIILGGIGFYIAWSLKSDPKKCADLLRFYWFRMCDFAVPMGVSFTAIAILDRGVTQWKSLFSKTSDALSVLRNTFHSVMVSSLIAAIVFLIFDAILFGWLFDSWINIPSEPGDTVPNIPAEPAIPWILTILVFVAMISVVLRFAKSEKTLQYFLSAQIVILCTITVWGPLNFYSQRAEQRMRFAYPRTDPPSARYAYWWNDICLWITEPENEILQDARFLTPKEMKNFKWLTQSPEVGIWKEIPQDAQGIIQWYATMEELYIYRPPKGPPRRDLPLQLLLKQYSPKRLEKIRKKYDFEYILCGKYPVLNLPIVYENPAYVIYGFRREAGGFLGPEESVDGDIP